MAEGEDPGDYIEQKKDMHDCFFLVGTDKKERISTVKLFLANYSSYFRAMLLETDMREKNSKEDIVFPDHEPDVFKLMLRYVYGRQNIKFEDVNQAMRFHILVDRCLMPKLKQISTNYLMQNCKTNLCAILECVTLLQMKEMEPRAKKILEEKTNLLLSSPGFIQMNPATIEFIVKQKSLRVTEVELWRALLSWAKHHCGNSSEGNVLRKKIDNFIKHVQFKRMCLKEFAEEVVPTSILTSDEHVAIFVEMATGKGNSLQEAASKTRHEWSRGYPDTCSLTFPFHENENLSSDNHQSYSNYQNCFEITSSRLTGFKIKSFEPKYFSLLIGNRSMNYAVVKLIDMDLSRDVALHSFNFSNGQFALTDSRIIVDLPNNFKLEASKRYKLWVQYSNNNSSLNISQQRGSARSAYNNAGNPPHVLQSCLFCTVKLTDTICQEQYSNYSSHTGLFSIVKTFTFSIEN